MYLDTFDQWAPIGQWTGRPKEQANMATFQKTNWKLIAEFPSLAKIAGTGRAYNLLKTFVGLLKAFKKGSINFFTDGYLLGTLKAQIHGQDYKHFKDLSSLEGVLCNRAPCSPVFYPFF